MIPKKPTITRSKNWDAVRKQWLTQYQTSCQACGIKSKLEVHHIVPVHIDATKELDMTNLITLCEYRGHDCHFHFGHLLNWNAYNLTVQRNTQEYWTLLNHRWE